MKTTEVRPGRPGLAQRLLTPRRVRRLRRGPARPVEQLELGRRRSGAITVGSADFPESALLAEIYAGALEAKGVKVEKKLNIGAREAYIPALQDGSIDLIPEYTGVLRDYFKKEPDRHRRRGRLHRAQGVRPRHPHRARQVGGRGQGRARHEEVAGRRAGREVDRRPRRPRPATSPSVARRSGRRGRPASPGFKKIYGLEFKAVPSARRRWPAHPARR